MKPSNLYISATIILGNLLSFSLTSCQADADADAPAPTSKMSVSFRVETRNDELSVGDEPQSGYEEASKWENYINIANGDYKIGFFDVDNNCITPFTPQKIEADDKGTYIDYTLTGEVPGILTLYSNFKIVVLANWGSYPEMIMGTHLDAICCPNDENLGRFQYFAGPDFKIYDGTTAKEDVTRYVPMYGVKEYKNVKFGIGNEENPTVVYDKTTGPVNMLRAIAKVEVMFDTTDEYTLAYDPEAENVDEIKPLYLTNYNEYGYCAPEGAYSEGDYYHKDWETDYWQGHLHLVGGSNHPKEKLAMTKMTNKDGKDVWVAYLPEYRNVASTSTTKDCQNAATSNANITPARIAVPLLRNEQPQTAYIDFATYDDKGEPDKAINIERNNLYRFTITHVDQGLKWKVKALPWNGLKHDPIVM